MSKTRLARPQNPTALNLRTSSLSSSPLIAEARNLGGAHLLKRRAPPETVRREWHRLAASNWANGVEPLQGAPSLAVLFPRARTPRCQTLGEKPWTARHTLAAYTPPPPSRSAPAPPTCFSSRVRTMRHRGAFQVNLGAARATVRPQSGEASERAGTPHGVPASRRGRLAAGASGTSGSRWEGGRPCGQPANRAAGGAEVSLSILPAPHPPYVPRPIAVGHLDWGMPSPTL